MDSQKVFECREFNDINKIVEELSDKLENKYVKLTVEKFRQRFASKVVVTCDPEVVAHYATDLKVVEQKEEMTIVSSKVLSTVNVAKAGCITKANSTVFANMFENYNIHSSFSVTVPVILTAACREITASKRIKHWNTMVIYIPNQDFLDESLHAAEEVAELVSSIEPSTDNYRNYIRYKRLVAVCNKLSDITEGKLNKEELRSLLRTIKTEVLQNRINVKMNLIGTTSISEAKEHCTEGLTENVGKNGFRGKLTITPVIGDIIPKKFKEFRDGEKIVNNEVVREAAIDLSTKTAFIVKSESAEALGSVLDLSYDLVIYNAGNFKDVFDFKLEK